MAKYPNFDDYSQGFRSNQFMPQVVKKSRQLSTTYNKYKPMLYEKAASKVKFENNIAK